MTAALILAGSLIWIAVCAGLASACITSQDDFVSYILGPACILMAFAPLVVLVAVAS